jgi:uncharacterized integral membrane protein
MKQDFTRNIVIISGWLALLVILVFAVIKFANEQLAISLISFFTGSLGTALGFIFSERKKKDTP